MVVGERAAARSWRRLAPALLAFVLSLVFGPLSPLVAPALSQPAAGSASGVRSSLQVPVRTGEEIRGVWFTANDMDVLRDRTRMQDAVRQLAALHFNTIYPVVWNSGFAYYPSAVSERLGLQDFQYRGLQGQDILAELISEAHRQGLLVVPWFEFGFMVPPGSVLTRRQPSWLSRRRDGSVTSISAAGEVSWLNPMHPQVQELLSELILEIATRYDSDGIQFDDHTSLPSDFGYDAYTVALYQRSTGREPPANAADAAWLKWRADRISAFIQTLAIKLRQKRPGFLVSLSPNYHDFAYKRQLQDWLTWVRQGSVDEVVVQLYRPDLASFEAELKRPEFAASRQRVPTAVGILSGQRTQPVPIERVVAQATAARRQGLGSAYFYYESLWEQAQEPAEWRRQALASLYRQPSPRQSVAPLAPLASPAPQRPAAAISAPQPLPRPSAPPASPFPPAPPPEIPPRPMKPQGSPATASPISPPVLAPLPSAGEGSNAPRPLPTATPAPPATVPAAQGITPEIELPAVDPSWGPWNGAVEEIIPVPGAAGPPVTR